MEKEYKIKQYVNDLENTFNKSIYENINKNIKLKLK
jgi:hypothetical protein